MGLYVNDFSNEGHLKFAIMLKIEIYSLDLHV